MRESKHMECWSRSPSLLVPQITRADTDNSITMLRFIGNFAGATGGAIDFKSSAMSSATFQNVTFADNIASMYYSALQC